jgi:hypothetical protein
MLMRLVVLDGPYRCALMSSGRPVRLVEEFVVFACRSPLTRMMVVLVAGGEGHRPDAAR